MYACRFCCASVIVSRRQQEPGPSVGSVLCKLTVFSAVPPLNVPRQVSHITILICHSNLTKMAASAVC